MKKETCKICSNEFILGETGSTYGCDGCAGIIRDRDGNMSIPYNLVNIDLQNEFGHDMVKLVPHKRHEYALRFSDEFDMDDLQLIEKAKGIVSCYRQSQWFDDEIEAVEKW